jgi:Xaa-Pro aminopeptidase
MTTGFGRFYTFETLTLCPFDLSLFEIESMTEEEIEWVDDYHQRVYDALAPHLDAEGQAWLAEHTRSLLILQ